MNQAVELQTADITGLRQSLHSAVNQVNELVVGKPNVVKLSFACLLANGHLLLEDLPGLGKTTLAHALAISIGLDYQRVQFTSDMLPADIIGISIYSRQKESFEFHPGPVFSQVMLADEVNRATPKTQSALLEAMAERQVSVDGQTRSLPEPFFVIATQNPVDLAGTFPLPDSQLDRFLMKLQMGYPDPAAERKLLEEPSRQGMLAEASKQMTPADLMALQRHVAQVHAAAPLLDYLQALVNASRHFTGVTSGISPRGALAILQAARAWAALEDRDHLLPEDIQAVFGAVAAHRLRPDRGNDTDPTVLAQQLLEQVPAT